MNSTPDLDERLDEALDESFPASDPPAVHAIDPPQKPAPTPRSPESQRPAPGPVNSES
jgi:hypothetical protein